jgi:formiminoglutamase
MAPLPLILSLPHGGLAVPPEMHGRILIDEIAIRNDCDLCADELYDFAHPGLASGVLATVSMSIARVFIDANRRPDDLDNPDGPVKSQTSYGAPIYAEPPTRAEQQHLLARHWQPYHDRLAGAVAQQQGRAKLLLDCHNMAQHSPSAYAHAGAARPFICLANLGDGDGRPTAERGWTSCSPELIQAGARLAQEIFADLTLLEPGPGERPPVVAINWPFKGGYILEQHTAPHLPALMIEVNRGLFIGDQDAARPSKPDQARIEEIRRRLLRWVQELVLVL